MLVFAFGLRLHVKMRLSKTRALGSRVANGKPPMRLRFRDLRGKTLAFKKVHCDSSQSSIRGGSKGGVPDRDSDSILYKSNQTRHKHIHTTHSNDLRTQLLLSKFCSA